MRMGMLEVVTNLIMSVAVRSDEDGETGADNDTHGDDQELNKRQIDGFYDLLQERFRDVNSYTRSKVLQCLCRLAE
jgi:condensin complex subunit 1